MYRWKRRWPAWRSLSAQGKIRRWGVSNFDVEDMQELLQTPGGENCAVDQVLYHLGSRGIEYALLPLLAQRGIGVMAYCPLAQAGAVARTGRGLLRHPAAGTDGGGVRRDRCPDTARLPLGDGRA